MDDSGALQFGCLFHHRRKCGIHFALKQTSQNVFEDVVPRPLAWGVFGTDDKFGESSVEKVYAAGGPPAGSIDSLNFYSVELSF